MISSEVQRTLVKSPPELWAEISDPESLARHLGEFGEIRITRVQPEQKVEWEGDSASGTVVIKPSGWGTKVKLTVTRDPAVDSDGVAARDGGDRPGPALAAELPVDDGSLELGDVAEIEREQELVSSPEPESVAELQTVLEVDAVPELDSASEAEDASEPEPVPPQLPSAAPTDLAAAAPTDLTAEPEAAVAAETAPVVEPQPQPQPTDRSDQAPEPVARRGFFARLFGRRRGTAQQQPAVPALEADRDDPPAPIAEEPVSEEPIADEPIAEEPIAETLSAHAPTVAEPTGDALAADELTADELAADDPTPDEPTAFKPTGLDPTPNEPPADPASRPGDGLAGELAAAEEVTAEQVEAVLTGVLDRLGAAHHRPFSRS